jgi:hypothetical protein
MRSVPRGSGIRSAIVVVEVVAPLALALNGCVSVFSRAAALQLGLEVGGGEAHCYRCAHHHRCA